MATQKTHVPEMGTIEVFQELHIQALPNELPAVRQRLIDTAQAPWMHEKQCQNRDPNFTVFHHHGDDSHNTARLTLRQNSDGFDVVNINPFDSDGLHVQRYNDLLQDFAENVVAPALKHNGAAMALSDQRQGPADWLKPEAACALYKFCRNANKGVDYSHPGDWDRWMDFLIKAHDSHFAASACDHVERWLRESEGWSERMSHRLSVDLRVSAELLKHYDRILSERSTS